MFCTLCVGRCASIRDQPLSPKFRQHSKAPSSSAQNGIHQQRVVRSPHAHLPAASAARRQGLPRQQRTKHQWTEWVCIRRAAGDPAQHPAEEEAAAAATATQAGPAAAPAERGVCLPAASTPCVLSLAWPSIHLVGVVRGQRALCCAQHRSTFSQLCQPYPKPQRQVCIAQPAVPGPPVPAAAALAKQRWHLHWKQWGWGPGGIQPHASSTHTLRSPIWSAERSRAHATQTRCPPSCIAPPARPRASPRPPSPGPSWWPATSRSPWATGPRSSSPGSCRKPSCSDAWSGAEWRLPLATHGRGAGGNGDYVCQASTSQPQAEAPGQSNERIEETGVLGRGFRCVEHESRQLGWRGCRGWHRISFSFSAWYCLLQLKTCFCHPFLKMACCPSCCCSCFCIL